MAENLEISENPNNTARAGGHKKDPEIALFKRRLTMRRLFFTIISFFNCHECY